MTSEAKIAEAYLETLSGDRRVVIERLGTQPQRLRLAKFGRGAPMVLPKLERREPAKKDLVSVDVYFNWRGQKPEELVGLLEPHGGDQIKLLMITNRGVKVYSGGFPETVRADHWRGRFTKPDDGIVTHFEVVALLERLANAGLDFIKTEHMYNFDGKPGYSLGQGQQIVLD
jgi:isocitrate dehydrogenase